MAGASSADTWRCQASRYTRCGPARDARRPPSGWLSDETRVFELAEDAAYVVAPGPDRQVHAGSGSRPSASRCRGEGGRCRRRRASRLAAEGRQPAERRSQCRGPRAVQLAPRRRCGSACRPRRRPGPVRRGRRSPRASPTVGVLHGNQLAPPSALRRMCRRRRSPTMPRAEASRARAGARSCRS